ncbi:MAG TPA: ABC transporter permease [Crocinitomix sp.]|nr:ABC transporter permease [Crocinitomix sp.]
MIKTIAIKDLKLFFSDKKSVIITFILPILLITLFAFAFGGIGNSNEPRKIDLLITDLDNSTESKELIKSLDSIKGLHIITTTLEKANNAVKKGNYIAVLVLQKGYQIAIEKSKPIPLELRYDQSREAEVGMLQAVLMEKLMQKVSKEAIQKNIENFLDKEFAGIAPGMKRRILEKTTSDDGTSTNNFVDFKMTAVLKEDKGKTNFGLIQAVAGTAIMMLLFSIAEIGGGLLDEKEGGTLKRLRYSPLKPKEILFGKMGAALIIALLQLVVMFIFSWLAFGLPIFRDIVSLLILIFAVAFAVASFGIFLVSIAKTRKQLSGLSSMIILTMSAIGGSMIPLFVMPPIMQKIAVVSVNYWGIQGFYDIFARSLPLVEILPRIAVLLGIGIIMSVISLRLFKKNLFNME